MSRWESIEETCPDCGHVESVRLWEIINVDLDPEMRDQLFSGKVNLLVCSACGLRAVAVRDVVYHDMKNGFIVWLTFSDEPVGPAMKTQDGAVSQPPGPNYRMRIVRSLNQMLEKILIFECGLDDRIVEFEKFAIRVKQPRFSDNREDCLIFKRIEESEGKIELTFLATDKEANGATAIYYDIDAYVEEVEKLRPFIDEQDWTGWREVDLDFALDLVRGIEELTPGAIGVSTSAVRDFEGRRKGLS